jgi:hypothetical protein
MDRLEALSTKSKTYTSDEQCVTCNGKERYTHTRACVFCVKKRASRPGSPRNIAKAAKLVTYQTGKPCKKGHVAMRYTSTGQCVECVNPKSDLVSIRLRIHPQDIPKLEAYATALRMDRPPLDK